MPIDAVPEFRWVDRDEDEIHVLVRLAGMLMAELHERTRAGRR